MVKDKYNQDENGFEDFEDFEKYYGFDEDDLDEEPKELNFNCLDDNIGIDSSEDEEIEKKN
jgi:hypothetical protein